MEGENDSGVGIKWAKVERSLLLLIIIGINFFNNSNRFYLYKMLYSLQNTSLLLFLTVTL